MMMLLVFVIPAVVWLVVRWFVLSGYPFPDEAGLLWHDVPLADRALGVGRAVAILTTLVFLPARLCGDYGADVAFHPDDPTIAYAVPVDQRSGFFRASVWLMPEPAHIHFTSGSLIEVRPDDNREAAIAAAPAAANPDCECDIGASSPG